MTPKCTHWRGHKFEGRYSEELPAKFFDRITEIRGNLLETAKNKTYERDICIRCGYVIERGE